MWPRYIFTSALLISIALGAPTTTLAEGPKPTAQESKSIKAREAELSKIFKRMDTVHATTSGKSQAEAAAQVRKDLHAWGNKYGVQVFAQTTLVAQKAGTNKAGTNTAWTNMSGIPSSVVAKTTATATATAAATIPGVCSVSKTEHQTPDGKKFWRVCIGCCTVEKDGSSTCKADCIDTDKEPQL